MKQVNASIITIGDELLIGQTIDTNSAWIGQQLNALGIWLKKRIAVGDNKNDIISAIDEEMKMYDLIIVTGGLGPTADDITKPLLSEYFGGQLVENEKVKQHVIAFFEKRKRPILDVNVAQAMVPNVCEVLWNEFGSAPGMWFEKHKRILISLPGVPFEMKSIMTNEALPKIKTYFTTPNVIHKTIATAGKGESFIAVILQEFENNLPKNVKLAYLPKLGGVKLRLTGIEIKEQDLQRLADILFEKIEHIAFAKKDIELEECIGELLLNKNATISTAESCTGGAIMAKLTSIKGSSNYCKGSIISYTNETKLNVLNVPKTMLDTFTAVSEQVAIEMAINVQQKLNTTYALSITGYLDAPANDDSLKGKIWIAITDGINTKTIETTLPYNRLQNTELAINTALNNLRIFITKQPHLQ